MQGPSDETLIAYLDGELAGAERLAVAQALAEDDALRARAQRLNDSTRLIRAAYDAVLREPVPERLIGNSFCSAAQPDYVLLSDF